MASDQDKWNARYTENISSELTPAAVLSTCEHLLPSSGKTLDLACGKGANAIFLAELNLESHAWDISDVVINQLKELANNQGLTIHAVARDVVLQPPEHESFDVIVVSRFLDRDLISALKHAICPGGYIFYQTFIKDKVDAEGPENPEYRLGQNELLSLFQDWIIRYYREEGTIGDTSAGFRNQAMLVAQKN